jgi:hypothetical protein
MSPKDDKAGGDKDKKHLKNGFSDHHVSPVVCFYNSPYADLSKLSA